MVIVAAIVVVLPLLATWGDHDEAVTEVVRACKKATDLLGADAHPARIGLACGSTETSSMSGEASWDLAYTGDRGRGDVRFRAIKSGDEWRVVAAVLEIDGEEIDLVACAGITPMVKAGRLAQTNADGLTGELEGKVLRSNHPTIGAGHQCTGRIARERGSTTATLDITCRESASDAEGTQLYKGSGAFTLDVKDSARREDDHVEFDDSTNTPGCRLSAADGKGTLTVFSRDPAWEIVVEL